MMKLGPEDVVDLGDLSQEAWMDYAIDQGWSDGLPMLVPTEEAIAPFLAIAARTNEPMPPIPPRNLTPSIYALAANAVMAGCKPDYFPIVLTALRATLEESYNLHGSMATTHPCANMLLVSGPGQHRLGINAGSNCFGQGTRANAAIGRALQLILRNIGGAYPGSTDRATHGTPAKYSFCFGESEAESPWEPYRVRYGFGLEDTVVTVMPAEGPHNVNDHASTTGDQILTTIAETMSQAGSNNVMGRAPSFVVLGPEHAETLHRDQWTIPDIQTELFERSRIHFSRLSRPNVEFFFGFQPPIKDDHFYLSPSAEDIHIVVAGGPGKHSAWIPAFGFNTVISMRVPPE